MPVAILLSVNSLNVDMMQRLCCLNLFAQIYIGITYSSKSMMNKLRICYNNCLRRLMNIPKFCSASQMFVYLNVPSFGEILRRNMA